MKAWTDYLSGIARTRVLPQAAIAWISPTIETVPRIDGSITDQGVIECEHRVGLQPLPMPFPRTG